jgi:anti-anti-sigma factor
LNIPHRRKTLIDREVGETRLRKEEEPAEITIVDVSGCIKVMQFSGGEIDLSNCSMISESFGVHHKEGDRWVFDLSNISFMDSEAIKSLLICIRRVGLDFVAFICNKGSMPFRVLKLSGLAELVSIYNDNEQAVENLRVR